MNSRARMIRLGRRGNVAMEFAIVAPVLILLSFGIIDFAAAVRVQIGVNQAARAVANLIVQQSNVTTAQLNDFYIAGQDCYAFNAGVLSISATSVKFAAGSAAGSVGWDASGVSGKYTSAPANIVTLSSGLGASSGGTVVGGDGAIVVQTQSTFTVPVSYWPIPPSFTFTSTVFARPRASFVVSLNGKP